MANRKWDKLQTVGIDRKIVEGSFAPAGAGAPTTIRGSGVSGVTRDSQGTFLVQADIYSDLESAIATVQSATLLHSQIESWDEDGVTLRLVDAAGAVQDLAADANNRVHFRFVFRNSSRA
jgi:hypothetical protein